MTLLLLLASIVISFSGSFYLARYTLSRWISLNPKYYRLAGFVLFVIYEFFIRQIGAYVLSFVPEESNPGLGALMFIFGLPIFAVFAIVYISIGLNVGKIKIAVAPVPETTRRFSPRLAVIVVCAAAILTTFFGTRCPVVSWIAKTANQPFICIAIPEGPARRDCILGTENSENACALHEKDSCARPICFTEQAKKQNSIATCEELRQYPLGFALCAAQFVGTPEHTAWCKKNGIDPQHPHVLAYSRCLTSSNANQPVAGSSDDIPAWFYMINPSTRAGAGESCSNVKSSIKEDLAWLKSIGADPNARDARGHTALFYAVENLRFDAGSIPELVAFGVDARIPDAQGNHALDYVLPTPNSRALQALIDADPDYIPRKASVQSLIEKCMEMGYGDRRDERAKICPVKVGYDSSVAIAIRKGWIVERNGNITPATTLKP